jgi:hypothetical protein
MVFSTAINGQHLVQGDEINFTYDNLHFMICSVKPVKNETWTE